jgi:hypothetical protein
MVFPRRLCFSSGVILETRSASLSSKVIGSVQINGLLRLSLAGMKAEAV